MGTVCGHSNHNESTTGVPSIGHHAGSPPRSELNLDEPPSVYSPACVMVPAAFGQALSVYSLASPDVLA